MNYKQESRFRRLWASNRSVNQIGTDMGVSRWVIYDWRKKLGLKKRTTRGVRSFYLSAKIDQPSGPAHELWKALAQRYCPVVACDGGFRIGCNRTFVTTGQAEEIAAGKYLNHVAA